MPSVYFFGRSVSLRRHPTKSEGVVMQTELPVFVTDEDALTAAVQLMKRAQALKVAA